MKYFSIIYSNNNKSRLGATWRRPRALDVEQIPRREHIYMHPILVVNNGCIADDASGRPQSPSLLPVSIELVAL
jgi:hypothetical protein